MRTKPVVLLSGGIDSAACTRYLQDEGYEPSCVFVDYRQSAVEEERRAAVAVAEHLHVPLTVISIPAQRTFGVGEIVGRNAFFVMVTMTLCDVKSGVIVLGIVTGPWSRYYDCSPAFLTSIDRLVAEYSDGRIE